MHTPRHWTGRRRLLSIPRQHGRTQADAATVTFATATWTPQPLDAQDVGAQARRELAAIARRDAWAGLRDTDRRA